MQSKVYTAFLGMVLVFSFIGSNCIANPWSDVASISDTELIEAIIKLDLGFEKYRLGQKLSEKDIEFAKKNSVKNAYAGTLNFKDGEVGIVTDYKSKTIIALYLDDKYADQEKIKKMIGSLMASFGQPTTMAHDKIVYWAFNNFGLIAEEEHAMAKKPTDLNILATVKFSSKDKIMEGESATEKNEIYCIISSPELLKRFMKK